MGRPAKPFFRKQTKSWYCSIDGRQISLGANKRAAFEKFHELMADREKLVGEFTTLYELSQIYLDWCEKNRADGTYNRHRYYLKSFIESVERLVDDLRFVGLNVVNPKELGQCLHCRFCRACIRHVFIE